PVLEYHPDVRQFFLIDRKWRKLNFFKRFKKELDLIRDLKNQHYDMAFNLTEGDRGALYAFLSKAKMRIGLDSNGDGFFLKNKLYTKVVKNCPTIKHTVEMNLDFLRSIGFHPPFWVRELTLN